MLSESETSSQPHLMLSELEAGKQRHEDSQPAERRGGTVVRVTITGPAGVLHLLEWNGDVVWWSKGQTVPHLSADKGRVSLCVCLCTLFMYCMCVCRCVCV